MRGLAMALLAFDVPGFGGTLSGGHWAGRIGVPFPSIANTGTTTKTITKKTTAKTV